MSLEIFIDKEANYLKYELKKYHKVMDYLLGFLDESQWQQALEESLKEEDLSYSIMEDVFESYVSDWSIDTNVDEVILKACYNVRNFDLDLANTHQIYKAIITNLEAKKD